jgi:NAD(P)H-flavin reductase
LTTSTRPARVVARRALTPRVFELSLEVPGEPPFRWRAGQHLAIHPAAGVPTHEGPLWYSIASAWDGREPPVLALAIGPGTGADTLATVGPGDELELSGPYGSFTLPDAAGVLLIGVGTGVAPLRALVEEALASKALPKLLLLAGARAEQDLLWHEELAQGAAQSSRFRYEPVLSKPSDAWRGRRGHVQDHLRDVLRGWEPSFKARLCGSVTMVESSVRTLHELGVPVSDIQSESY